MRTSTVKGQVRPYARLLAGCCGVVACVIVAAILVTSILCTNPSPIMAMSWRIGISVLVVLAGVLYVVEWLEQHQKRTTGWTR